MNQEEINRKNQGSNEKKIPVTSLTKWIVSYRSECPLIRFAAMLSGKESRQPNDTKQTLIVHLLLVLFLEHFQILKLLIEDLLYKLEIIKLPGFRGLLVMLLKVPLFTFLPSDDFIVQVTHFLGIPAFQELIDLEALQNISDPLKVSLLAISE